VDGEAEGEQQSDMHDQEKQRRSNQPDEHLGFEFIHPAQADGPGASEEELTTHISAMPMRSAQCAQATMRPK
jgi:hypothetical protein